MKVHPPHALYRTLPKAPALLAAFSAGVPSPEAPCSHIVGVGVKLLAAHQQCLDSERRIRAYADDPHDDGDRWSATTKAWLQARAEIIAGIAEIDSAVQAQRIAPRRSESLGGLQATESVGHAISRMARLFAVLESVRSNGPLPEAEELMALCDGYNSLIVGLADGTLRLYESWRRQS